MSKYLYIAVCALLISAHQAVFSQALSDVFIYDDNEIPRVGNAKTQKTGPQSGVQTSFIQSILSPYSDYAYIANYTPGFLSSAPNGPGFDAAKNATLRGFSDGQFNVTVDGIPLQDPDTLKHHSTSFFPASTIQAVQVDRSPGSLQSLGYSTFGGTLNILTLGLPKQAFTTLYGSVGSFETRQFGLTHGDSKTSSEGATTSYVMNAVHDSTQGSIHLSSAVKDDFLLKGKYQFHGTDITLLLSYDNYRFNNPPSVSLFDVQKYGPRTGFNDVSGTAAYKNYSETNRHNDFDYIHLRTPISHNSEFTQTLYTYAYHNNGLGLKGDITSSLVGGNGSNKNDIAGTKTNLNYRTYGSISKVKSTIDFLGYEFGVWLEASNEASNRNTFDLTTQSAYGGGYQGTSTLFNFNSRLKNIQPFAQLTWNVTDRLSIVELARFSKTTRSFSADVIPNKMGPTDGVLSTTLSSFSPTTKILYALDKNLDVYLQNARGALLPSQSYFYTSNPLNNNQVNVQKSNAIELGVGFDNGSTKVHVDVYSVKVRDFAEQITLNNQTYFQNLGKVNYKGIEVEGETAITSSFRVFGNVSASKGVYADDVPGNSLQKSGDRIPLSPTYLGLIGLIYHVGPWELDTHTRFVGSEFQGKNGSSDGSSFAVHPYRFTNAGVSYHMASRPLMAYVNNASIRLQINNLFNSQAVTDASGLSVTGDPLVNVLAPRSVVASLKIEL